MQQGNSRNAALDGVRGYASLVVMLYHAILGFNYAGTTSVLSVPIYALNDWRAVWWKLWLTAFNGESAVVLFFIMSGYVLTCSVQRDTGRYGVAAAFLGFSIRRIVRIYPLLFLALAVSWLASFLLYHFRLGGPHSFVDLWLNALLFDYRIIGPTWTLQIEMLAAPFIAVSGAVLARMGFAGVLAFLLFAVCAHEVPALVLGNALLAQYLYCIALGCLMATRLGPIAAGAAKEVGWGWLLAGFLFIRMLLPYGAIANMTQATFGFTLLSMLAHGGANAFSRFLSNGISQELGRVSFGFYIWNAVALTTFWALRAHYPTIVEMYPVLFGLLFFVLVAPPILLLSSVTERYFEMPFIRIGRALSGAGAFYSPRRVRAN